MASLGQHCGSCGHLMARFDFFDKCDRCHFKGLGTDACIMDGAICSICE